MAVNGHHYGAKIVIASPSATYHTYTTWGLTLTNGDPIGAPEQETNYITIPGRSNLLDYSDALTGHPVFKGRTITMNMAMSGEPDAWVSKVSKIRNAIEGKQVKVYFDDDPSHYWLGRINIKDSTRTRKLGQFTMLMYADAYKYDKYSSQERIKWDDINFETDCFRYLGAVQITDSGTITVPKGFMEVVPTIRVTNKTSENFTMTVNNTTYTLANNTTYKYPEIKVCGASDKVFTFTGTAKVTITYRGGSL